MSKAVTTSPRITPVKVRWTKQKASDINRRWSRRHAELMELARRNCIRLAGRESL